MISTQRSCQRHYMGDSQEVGKQEVMGLRSEHRKRIQRQRQKRSARRAENIIKKLYKELRAQREVNRHEQE